jgi:hypothetical protein
MSALLHVLHALEPLGIGFGFGWLAQSLYDRVKARR